MGSATHSAVYCCLAGLYGQANLAKSWFASFVGDPDTIGATVLSIRITLANTVSRISATISPSLFYDLQSEMPLLDTNAPRLPDTNSPYLKACLVSDVFIRRYDSHRFHLQNCTVSGWTLSRIEDMYGIVSSQWTLPESLSLGLAQTAYAI